MWNSHLFNFARALGLVNLAMPMLILLTARLEGPLLSRRCYMILCTFSGRHVPPAHVVVLQRRSVAGGHGRIHFLHQGRQVGDAGHREAHPGRKSQYSFIHYYSNYILDTARNRKYNIRNPRMHQLHGLKPIHDGRIGGSHK